MTGQVRRLSFGPVAEAYDRARPDYPDALVEDVIREADCRPGEEVLEIGAGTGKATRMFCARGLSVVAIEPDREMAAVASRQAATAGHALRIIASDFESAQLPAGAFALAYSAQAWHWVDPRAGYRQARRVLRDRGVLAAFWNRIDWSRCPIRGELQEAYREAGAMHIRGGPMHPSLSLPLQAGDEWHPGLLREAGFGESVTRRYERVLRYTTVEYVALLSTHSDHILLAADVRDRLLELVGEVIERHGGALEVSAPTLLCLARAS
ncbi:MAG TPA: class I SAM-dependent methyltransferase [Solirubrobacteraceae bacterium]|nr:class I SAM-dependent methyltransferase [Solirubrobacteraceae bacterium]